MRQQLLAPLFALALASGAAPTAHARSGTRKVSIADPVYAMEAATLEIPSDWKFAGTVARPGGCTSNGPSVKYTAQSPDGLAALETFPGYAWTWSSDPQLAGLLKKSGCTVLDALSAARFLKEVALPALRPNAKVESINPPRPEVQAKLEAQLQAMNAQTAQMAAQYRQPVPQTVLEGATAHLASTFAGQPVDETLTAVIYCTVSQMPALGPRARPVERHQCSANVIALGRGPRGKLASIHQQLEAIGLSYKADQAWSQRLAADMQRQGQAALAQQQAGTRAILQQGAASQRQRNANHAAFMQQQQESFEHGQANDRARQAAIDHSAQQTAQHSLDRGTYVNPNTGARVETSDQYSKTWQAGDGTVLHTNDVTYDPNGRDNQSWTELTPER